MAVIGLIAGLAIGFVAGQGVQARADMHAIAHAENRVDLALDERDAARAMQTITQVMGDYYMEMGYRQTVLAAALYNERLDGTSQIIVEDGIVYVPGPEKICSDVMCAKLDPETFAYEVTATPDGPMLMPIMEEAGCGEMEIFSLSLDAEPTVNLNEI